LAFPTSIAPAGNIAIAAVCRVRFDVDADTVATFEPRVADAITFGANLQCSALHAALSTVLRVVGNERAQVVIPARSVGVVANTLAASALPKLWVAAVIALPTVGIAVHQVDDLSITRNWHVWGHVGHLHVDRVRDVRRHVNRHRHILDDIVAII
jgi:hypothetical protein